jgi:hypothetical protein
MPIRIIGGAPGFARAILAGGARTSRGFTMRRRITWAFSALLLASCADYGAPSEVLNGTVVYSQPAPADNPTGYFYAPDYPKSGAKPIYYIDPEVNLVENGVPSTPNLPATVTSTIANAMDGLGWERTNTAPSYPQSAVGIKVSLVANEAAYYEDGYWCYYYWYMYCGYNWYYAGTYTYGSVVLEMADYTQLGSNDKPKAVWATTLYGIAYDYQYNYGSYDPTRINGGIVQAFSDSAKWLDATLPPTN